MESAMSHCDASETRPLAAPDEGPSRNLRLGELYRLQPLPDEFMRLALALGEAWSRPARRRNKGWFFRRASAVPPAR